jgi:hypothetical protein
MTTDEMFELACEKLDEATAIYEQKVSTHYRIADRLVREAKDLRAMMDQSEQEKPTAGQ